MPHRYFFTSCFLLCLPTLAWSQCERQGRVVSTNGEPIPFATISSLSRSTGTYADETGRFSFSGPCADSVQISAVGFSPVRKLTSQLDTVVRLTSITLPTVTILGKRSEKEQSFGYYRQVRFPPTYDFIPNTTCQLATFVENDEQQEGVIRRLNYRFSSKKSDLVNHFMVRVRLYRVNPKNQLIPGTDLLTESIVLPVEPSQKSLQHTLEKAILFPVEGVWVGLDVLGYEDKKGVFQLLAKGQFGKKGKGRQYVSPSVAMRKKAPVVGRCNLIGTTWTSIVLDWAPMFGLDALF